MIGDSRGLEDLPLRFVVTIIVGSVALSAVVGYTLLNVHPHKTLDVSLNTLEIEEGLGKKIDITVTSHGNPIKGATVVCTGCGDAASGKTDENGKVTLYMDIVLPQNGRYENFLDLIVDAKGYDEFKEENYIRVVKVDYSEFLEDVRRYMYNEIKENEKLNIGKYHIIDNFPISISNTVEKGNMDIYILDPELANQIPDDFYISFLGDGMTIFSYKVIELYRGNEQFPQPNTINKIEWKDGFIDWIPKEIQGCNVVYHLNLKHQSPRTVAIIVEREIKKASIKIEELD
ncbi:MAG TPA: hypothetical protein ENI51_01290, partial [Candidatus Atribacteria bacterium]|nr:hypothetical protein [Candidatus Atribacteria bacterium]